VIAATAEIHDAPLMTLNVKHFPMFEGLQPAFDPNDDRADRV
jgi:predicted nucleic acid-binding protein